tara:strand:+ start:1656 stop:1907 length:252 start_codon:yes stop_codon:yes gene_type:complete
MREKTLVRLWWAWVAILIIAIAIMVVGVIQNESGKDRAKLRSENAFRARWQAKQDTNKPHMTAEEATRLIQKRLSEMGDPRIR